jgi:hypothetical protein
VARLSTSIVLKTFILTSRHTFSWRSTTPYQHLRVLWHSQLGQIWGLILRKGLSRTTCTPLWVFNSKRIKLPKVLLWSHLFITAALSICRLHSWNMWIIWMHRIWYPHLTPMIKPKVELRLLISITVWIKLFSCIKLRINLWVPRRQLAASNSWGWHLQLKLALGSW